MTSRLNPYIGFKDNARQAMEFYRDVFGGELTMMTFDQMGAAQNPADGNKVMHAMLQTPTGFALMAADTPSGMEYQPGSQISVSLSGDNSDELHRYWNKLSDNGSITMPMEKQTWGDEFGMCVDKFGISWMVDVGQPAT